ncbi:ankyrin repeat domain-containing protein 10-like isoform X2 [Ptychodera flava]|uniref:ankyrin repeat domain-containing protein 10-like isoform X2 n=1 Tax=Ptychodera flava TaxID=63121 RepID=UPI003969E7AD
MESSYSFGYWGSESEAILRRSYPVHRACRDGDTQTLALLIANGQHSGMYVEDQFYGWTPAHWAAYFGKLDCLRNLVACGVNIDIATKRFNQTPLHIAAFGVHPHCLQWLIQSGADVNRQDYLGETAMHKAARSGTVECIGLLYCHGSQLNIANHNGHTLIQLAISCGNEHCAEYIKQLSVGHPAANGFHRNGFHQAADPPQQNGFHNNVSSNNNSLPHSMNRKRALVDDDEMSCFKKSRTDGPRCEEIDDVAMAATDYPESVTVTTTGHHDSLAMSSTDRHEMLVYESKIRFPSSTRVLLKKGLGGHMI